MTNPGPELRQTWRKSSWSDHQGACVEVAANPQSWAVRDSKNPGGGQLGLPPGGWSGFVATVRNDRLAL